MEAETLLINVFITYAERRGDHPILAHQKLQFPLNISSFILLICAKTYLTRHHHKRSGKPIMLENFSFRANKCEIEPNIWRRSQV